MRVFSIEGDGEFREYQQTPFQVDHEEAVLETWLESNPDGILEDSRVLVLGRQVATNLGGFIDLLGLDRDGRVVVVEIKRDRTPRDTVAQALEYASFAARLDAGQLEGILQSYLNDQSLTLAEFHREFFGLGPDEAVAFNKDQRIVVVGQTIRPEIRQVASFLRSKGIEVTCIEFTFFRGDGGTSLLCQEIVVGKESDKPKQPSSGSRATVTEEAFLESADDNGKIFFSQMLAHARERSMPIHWGSKGFSLNIDLNGVHVAVFYVYPPNSGRSQSVYTALADQSGIAGKTAVPESVAQALRDDCQASGLFSPAGRELKCVIDHEFTDAQISTVLAWLDRVADAVMKHGLKE